MAFGKDENNKTRLQGTFSQRAALTRRLENAGREGGGGKAPAYWRDNFKPNEIADTIRCIQGEYQVQEIDEATGELVMSVLPYLPCMEHYHGSLKRGALCSAGPYHMNRNKRSPCHGCDMFWEDFEIRKQRSAELGTKVNNPKRIGKSNKYVITVLDTGMFYESESIDSKTGQPRVNKDGKPFMDWHKLRYANDPMAQGKKMKQGMVMPWAMNNTEFELLQSFSEKNIGTCCSGCGTWGHAMSPTLQTLQYVCQGCSNVLIDKQTSTIPPNQIDEIVKLPIGCQRCGQRNFALEVVHCPTCVQKGTTPRRSSLWDVDIQVRLVKSLKDPKKHELMIDGYSAPMPINQQFEDIAKPLDLVKIYAPTPLDQQAALWSIQQSSAQPAVQHTQPYQQ
jgi:ribosomal protein L37E